MQAVCDCNLFVEADDSALLVSDKGTSRTHEKLGEKIGSLKQTSITIHLILSKTEYTFLNSNYIKLSWESTWRL